jgi:hypothetical protein
MDCATTWTPVRWTVTAPVRSSTGSRPRMPGSVGRGWSPPPRMLGPRAWRLRDAQHAGGARRDRGPARRRTPVLWVNLRVSRDTGTVDLAIG